MIRSSIKCCPICRLPKIKEKFLCKACLYRLGPPKLKKTMIQGVPVLSLYRWGLENEDVLRRLVVSLKGGESVENLNLFFGVSIVEELRRLFPLGKWAIVPVASRLPGLRDHATALAEVLSFLLRLQMFTVLESSKKSSQKSVGRALRQRVEVCKADPIWKAKRVLLVDDVVTTGSTLKASKIALKGVSEVYGFSLAERLLVPESLASGSSLRYNAML